MEWVQELLAKSVEPDKLEALVKAFDEELPKQFIPKGRFNDVNDELKLVKTQLAETGKSVEELSKKASSVDEYEKKVADLLAKYHDLEESSKKQVGQITKRSQLKELLLTNNVHKDAVDLLVDKYQELAEVDEKGIKDPVALLAKIREEKGGLFVEIEKDGNEKGGHKKAGADDDAAAKIRKLYGLK